MQAYTFFFTAYTTLWGKRESGRLSTVDHLLWVAHFVKKVKNIFKIKGADLNWLVQGGQLY